MRHKCRTKSSIPCWRSAGKTPSVPSDLNGLKVPSAHLIFNWLITHLARFQFPLFVVRPHMPKFSWSCPSSESLICLESGKWNLNNSFSVPFPVLVYWPSSNLIEQTLLVAGPPCGLVVRVPGYRSRCPGFDSGRYQIFREVVGLERGSLSLVSTIEELLGRNNGVSGLENREYGHGNPLFWPRDTLYPQKLALTSTTNGGR
jgi:hypothetical protein